ncbi:MAG: phosphoglycolate phosphatase [Pseudomonadota bacterium]
MHDFPHDLPADLGGWTIAFDLDGTLVDTAPDLVGALNAVLVEEGLPPVPMAQVRLLIGRGARWLVRRGFELAGEPLAEDRLDSLRLRFVSHYRPRIARESRPFPGCLAALAGLRARGARLAVCTNKPQGLALDLLGELAMLDLFEAVVGGDALPVQKPDPRHLLAAVEQAGGHRARAVLVGDGSPDVGAAQAAGVPCVVVDFGYNEVPAAEMGGDLVIGGYDELAGAVNRLVRKMVDATGIEPVTPSV